MLNQLEQLFQQAQAELAAITASDALREWDSKFLGKKGEITLLLRSTGQLPAEERPQFGKRANEIKELLEAAYTERAALIEDQEIAADLESGEVDITLPGRRRAVGGLHPSTRTLREFNRIWGEMGFQVFRSREVEDDNTNFTLLNMPPHHPARDMQDTFYTTEPNVILRTHT
ncbi:MAG: phenylalanine--tRNA ligase subunit alpha, partial [Phototrophicaceae bacterium]